MKIEVHIDETKLAESVLHHVANNVVDEIFGKHDYSSRSDETRKKAVEEILKKIDWKNAGAQLSETVIQQFFLKLMENKK